MNNINLRKLPIMVLIPAEDQYTTEIYANFVRFRLRYVKNGKDCVLEDIFADISLNNVAMLAKVATALEIPGRSKMNKKQLAEAVHAEIEFER